jgi:hypothetical protein
MKGRFRLNILGDFHKPVTRKPKMNAATLRVKDNAIAPTLYRAMELSNKSWKLILGMA